MKSTLHQSRKGMLITSGLGVAVVTLIFLWFVMQLWHMDLAVPFCYSGDSLLFHQMTKSMIDNGWYLHNGFLGAPAGMDLHDFPQPEILHILVIKIISLFTGDYASTMNLFLIITYPLTALLAWYVFMKLGLSRFASFAGAVLYAFIPYHYLKGQIHILLAAYYMIPPALLVVMRVYSGELNFFSSTHAALSAETRNMRISGLVIAVLVSLTGIYYSFFACFFFIVAGAGRSFTEHKITPFLTSLLLSAVITVGLAASLSPSFTYIMRNGYNPDATHRVFHDADLYSLKITKLLLPVNGHRVQFMANIKEQYNRESSFIYRAPDHESDCSTLGLLGGAGFIVSLAALLFFVDGPCSKPVHARLRQQGSLNVAAVLLAISAGFSSFVAPLVNFRIRSYSRISIFIAFFSIYAFMIIADHLYEEYMKDRWRTSLRLAGRNIPVNISKILATAAVSILLLAGIYDQTGPSAIPNYAATKKAYKSDGRFVAEAEGILPRGTMIFQLPYLQFPEIATPPHRLLNFEYFKYYLHSKSLSWSYGAVNGRDSAAWQKRVSGLETGEMVREIKRSGFRAICISRNGYPDGGADIIRQIRQYTASQPIISPDGSAVIIQI